MTSAARLATLLLLLGFLLPGLPQRVDAAGGGDCCREQCCCREPAAAPCCGAERGAAPIAKLVDACDCGGSRDQAVRVVRHVTWFPCAPPSGVRPPRPAPRLALCATFPRDAGEHVPEPPVPRGAVG